MTGLAETGGPDQGRTLAPDHAASRGIRAGAVSAALDPNPDHARGPGPKEKSQQSAIDDTTMRAREKDAMVIRVKSIKVGTKSRKNLDTAAVIVIRRCLTQPNPSQSC